MGACAHGSYEALVADPAVDVVYVATPSTRHVSDSLLCLRAGKAVLCEKSMAPTAAEAAEVLALARERGLFFLHGVWSRFFPAMRALRELLSSGALLDAPEPIPTYLRHSSDTLLRHSSETPPTHLRDTSDTPPRLLRAPSSGAIGDVTSAHVSFCQNDGAGSCSALAEIRPEMIPESIPEVRRRLLLRPRRDGRLLRAVPLCESRAR